MGSGQEAPPKELARLSTQLVEVLTSHQHAHDVVRLPNYLLDAKPVAPELVQRLHHAIAQHNRESVGVQQAPGDL